MSRTRKIGRCAVFLGVLAVSWISAVPSYPWWDERWTHRKRITLDTTGSGMEISEPVTDLPVLIRLHAGNFDFAKVKEDGSDIRFVSSDDRTPLKYHVEFFDPIGEMALLWVRVPRVEPSSGQNHLWLYWGNKEAKPAQDPGGTYDVAQVLVYHFSETEGPPRDETANKNNAVEFLGSQGMPAVIGRGISLNGASDRLVLGRSPTLSFQNGMTFSAWIRPAGPQRDAYLLHFQGGDRAIVIGIDGYTPYCRITTEGGKGSTIAKGGQIPPEGWHHIIVTVTPQRRIAIYVDGLEVAVTEGSIVVPEPSEGVTIGASVKGDHGYAGELDELGLANVPRTQAWIRASFGGQSPETNLVSFGPDELSRAAGDLEAYLTKTLDYLRIVAKNTTLDGWLIISVLVIMGAWSWIVFVTKSFSLWAISRDNEEFLLVFAESDDIFSFQSKADHFPSSNLFRLYQAGCQELKGWIGNPGSEVSLSAKALDSVRAVLDRTLVYETKKLNSWLIVLSTTVSGGPFLGLLGTVWGVMNTFAAMVEAGEGSILAMAPGVSSALATTVFGLLVAIPSLFAHNYLVNRIRTLTADLQTFADQFAIRVDRLYGGER